MTKSNRQHDDSNNRRRHPAGFVRGITAVVAVFLFFGCTQSVRKSASPDDRTGCETVERALAESGMSGPIEMTGHAMIDVNQYRVRGRFSLVVKSPGTLQFEYQSSGVMGGGREDVVFSYVADTLRVLDRERGAFYEGDDVRGLVEEGVGDSADVREMVRRLLLMMPQCERMSRVGGGDGDVEGRLDGEAFRIDTASGRVAEARWPSPIATSIADRLEVSYRWNGARLVGLTLWMPEHRWRIRLQEDD